MARVICRTGKSRGMSPPIVSARELKAWLLAAALKKFSDQPGKMAPATNQLRKIGQVA